MRATLLIVVLSFLVLLIAVDLLAADDILLITMDTTRMDHLSCYGHVFKTTPFIDEFAKEARRFTRCYTPSPITLPAHVTVLTGLWPKTHGVRDNNYEPLDASIVTIAELLSQQGYRTAAFVSAFVLDRQFGLDRGFAHYDDRMSIFYHDDRDKINERTAPETEKEVLAYLSTVPTSDKLFLWVHLYDPHFPYTSHPGAPAGMSDYDGEIWWMDRSVGRILQAWDRARKGLVIITADHGEALTEHGEFFHGVFLYESCVRVPLLVRLEGNKKTGPDERLCCLVDLAATIADYADFKLKVNEGRSLLSEGPLHQRLFFESFFPANAYGWTPPFGILADGYKYILLPRPELYNVFEDNGERNNLIATQTARASELRNILLNEYGCDYVPPDMRSDEETVRRLKSLGYLSGNTARPNRDPKDFISVTNELYHARELWRAGRLKQAETALRKVLSVDVENIPAQIDLSDLLKEQGRRNEARDLLVAALKSNPRYTYALHKLGIMEYEAGAMDKARELLESAHRIMPENQEALLYLFWIALKNKDMVSAREHLVSAAAIDPDNADLHYCKGTLAAIGSDLPGAVQEFLRCLALDPKHARAMQDLGYAYSQLGRFDEALTTYRRSLSSNPDQPDVYLFLGALLWQKKKDIDAALEVYRTFLKRYPAHPAASRVRDILRQLGPSSSSR